MTMTFGKHNQLQKVKDIAIQARNLETTFLFTRFLRLKTCHLWLI